VTGLRKMTVSRKKKRFPFYTGLQQPVLVYRPDSEELIGTGRVIIGRTGCPLDGELVDLLGEPLPNGETYSLAIASATDVRLVVIAENVQ
jgi:hypothetical protein